MVFALLEMMEPGEILRISKEDFKWKKRTPFIFIKKISATSKKKFEMFNEAGKIGWVVRRVE